MDRRWDRIKAEAAELRELRLMLWRVAEPEWEDTRFEVKTAVIKAWLKEDPKYADFMCRPYGEGRVCFCPERVVGMAPVHV